MATSNGNDGVVAESVSVEDAVSKKRKSVGVNERHEPGLSDAQPGPPKKAKLEAKDGAVPGQPPGIPLDRSGLPVEIWLQIFMFCPPRTLGNLLCVNKLFNSCLDPSSTVKKPAPALLSPAKMTPQSIWRNARRSFWPNMPGPLDDKSEIDMWKLSCSSTCQFCGKRDTRSALPATGPLRFGPGSDGVAPIWAFRVWCCGSCLLHRSMKEIEFLLSEGSSFLMPALQFIFATPDPCLIPLSIIDRVQLPSVTLSKLFWTADVESLRQEFVSVKELGAPAVEEWQKGLSTRGAEQRANIAKWEKFAESGGVANMRTLLYPGYQLQPSLPVAHTRPDAAKTSSLPVVKPEPRNDASSHSLQPAQTEIAKHTPHDTARNIVQITPSPKANDTEEVIDEACWDKAWDEIQGPVRLKILKYADEAIIGDWDDGEKVTMHNAPSFAADVLLHARSRFYRQVEKDAADALASGRQPIVDPPQGPFTQKLTLENMKYVFDVKVKPITEALRKELFLCRACDYNSKFFGFEGVIQHYASKHTTALSQGSSVVFWRSEWPEVSPFKPDPRPPKNKSLHPPSAIPPRPTNPTPPKPLPAIRQSNNGQVSLGAPSLHPRPQFGTPAPQQSYPIAGANYVHDASSFRIGAVSNPLRGSSVSQVKESFNFGHLSTTQPPAFQKPPQQPPHSAPPLLPVADHIQPPSAAAVPGAHGTQKNDAPAVIQNSGGASRVPVPFAVRLNQTAKWTRTFWRSVGKANHLPVSLRLYLVIYHLEKKYCSTFNDHFHISLFIDGLARHKDMQPLRNINNLFCKACRLGLEVGAASMDKSTQEFSLAQLAHHFQITHVKGIKKPKNSPPLDWITDMLFLPQKHLLRHMLSPGDTWYPQLIEAINHLEDIQDGKLARNNQVFQQKATAVRDDSYSPQYNVASSLPNASVSSGKPTKKDEHVPGNGTKTTKERQDSSRDQPKSSHQPNKDGHSMWQQHWEFSGFQIKGKGTAQGPENAEENEKQEEEAIRAMWAADRVQTAQVQSSTSAQQAAKPTLAIERGPAMSQSNNLVTQKTQHALRDGTKTNKARPPIQTVAVKEENRISPGLRGVPFISKKIAPPAAEEPDLLGALETHLNGTKEPEIPEPRAATAIRRSAAGPVAHVDERGREDGRENAVQYEPYMHKAVPYEGERRARHVVDTRRPGAKYPWERPRSPMRQATNPRMVAAMEYGANGGHSSQGEGRRYVEGEPPYAARAVVGGEVPDGYVRARTRPVRYHDYAYGHGYDHAGYGENTRRVLPPVDRSMAYEMYQPYEVVEDYEVVRVPHPDGDYYARRPVQRERVFVGAVGEQYAGGQGRHYYSEVPAPASWPSMAAVPAAYEAGGRMVERRRDYSGVPAPQTAGYNGEMSGRGRERVAGAVDGLDTVMGGCYEEEYDPRKPATLRPDERPWPMRYQ